MNIRSTRFMTQAAVIAAAYLVLTLPFAQFAFGGPFQFRLSEVLTVLAALTPAAIPGLFIGCLLANLFNPNSLGLIDIIFGSLASLSAAWLTWQLHQKFPDYIGLHDRVKAKNEQSWIRLVFILSPSVWINAVVVGLYLPFLIPGQAISPPIVIGFIGSIFISQAVMVYLIGLPLLIALRRAFRGKALLSR